MLYDVCVVLIVAAFIFIGYRAGLMRSFVKIASYLISIVASFLLYPILSDLLMKTALYTKLTEFINEKYLSGGIAGAAENNAFGALTGYLDNGISAVASEVSAGIASLIISLIAFVLILILSKVIIRIAGNTLGLFTRLPIIKQFNRLGGGILGGVMGIFAVYIVFAILLSFAPVDTQNTVANEIEGSMFAAEFYNNNVILNYIGKGQ